MGWVKEYLLKCINDHSCIHITLLDPDKLSKNEFIELAFKAQEFGTSALMVGGSFGVSNELLDDYLSTLKNMGFKLPIILFPGSLAGLSKFADAVWFLSVLNSDDPYFIIGAQTQAAILIKKRFSNLDVISLAYIIIGEGETVGYVSKARPIPINKPEILLAYALAAEFIGFDFIYFEAGSGAKEPLKPDILKKIRPFIKKPIIVGGGIRSKEQAIELAKAGANIIVTGTIAEEDLTKLREIIEAINNLSIRK